MKDIDQIRRENMLLLEEESGGVTAAAERAEMSQAQWSNLRSGAADSKTGKPRGMRKETARKIESRHRKPAMWLDSDHGVSISSNTNMMVREACAKYEVNVEAGPDIRCRVPLISDVQAGEWSEAIDIYEPGYAEKWLPILKNSGEHTFALRVVGDSMTARFGKSYPDGCIIVVDPESRSPANGDRIIAKLHGSNEVTFKVFTKDAGRCWLRPLNDSHPPIYDEFTVIGTIIGKWEDD